MQYIENEIALSIIELENVLKRRTKGIKFFLGITAFLLLLYLFTYTIVPEGKISSIVLMVVAGIILLFITVSFIYFLYPHLMDYKAAKKIKIRGLVTDMHKKVRNTGTGISRRTYTDYYLYFNDRKVEVGFAEFEKVAIGMGAEIVFLPYSKSVLEFKTY